VSPGIRTVNLWSQSRTLNRCAIDTTWIESINSSSQPSLGSKEQIPAMVYFSLTLRVSFRKRDSVLLLSNKTQHIFCVYTFLLARYVQNLGLPLFSWSKTKTPKVRTEFNVSFAIIGRITIKLNLKQFHKWQAQNVKQRPGTWCPVCMCRIGSTDLHGTKHRRHDQPKPTNHGTNNIKRTFYSASLY